MVEINFSNYKNFDNVNDTYSNLIREVMVVIDKVGPIKTRRVKRNSLEWFDSDILGKLIFQDKLFKKYKKYSSYVDKDIYKAAR